MTRKWRIRLLWAIPMAAALWVGFDAMVSFMAGKIAAGVSLGIVATRVYEKLRWGNTVHWGEWHLHHSLFGIGILTLTASLALFYPGIKAQIPHWLGVAAGNIVQHTIAERRLVFWNRDRGWLRLRR